MVKRQIKVTVKRTVQVRQQIQTRYVTPQIQYQSQPQVVIDTAPVQKALTDVGNQLKTAQRQLTSSVRRQSLPAGVYSQPVEELFNGLAERRKSDETEASAMYDVFISHASEDKEDFVNPLVAKLQDAGIRVWYDTVEMQWGKSLREQIDNGIKRSKFAILVLSKHFFAKKWPQRELDGILAKESISGSTPLPIWHNITPEELYEFSSTLSGLFAYTTDKYSVDDICKSLELILEKEKS
ncbi:hypothetical protein FACS1894208_12960 [Clostridia bacterium]|nr:hypothetical protein FACS1894208_12960 [Clostridia bacterium]